jgi:hypothetical protein
VSGIDLTGIDLRKDPLLPTPRKLGAGPWRRPAEAVLAACQDVDTQRWITAVPVPCTEEDPRFSVREVAIAGRAAGRDLPVAIEAGGRPVGSSGVHHLTAGHPSGPRSAAG